MNASTLNPTNRFSDRVADYVKYRPSYPQDIITFMKFELGLGSASVVVDVGSGTGISAELFLQSGATVYGVEPNLNMRQAAEKSLGHFPKFRSQDGSAEQTGLNDQMADFLVAAQAFHWFDPKPTRKEMQRILKSSGYVLLIWNDRKINGSQFSVQYEELIHQFSTDYKQVNHKNIDHARIAEFLTSFELKTFYNFQEFDFDGLLGRLTSSSYMPNSDHPRFAEMRLALAELFAKHQRDGQVRIEYDTQVFYGRI